MLSSNVGVNIIVMLCIGCKVMYTQTMDGALCSSGALRLVGGDVNTEGRVEVCFNNRWGTVCDDEWDDNEASVVCRQLGFPSDGAVSVTASTFGIGEGDIFLDELMCSGLESKLVECPRHTDCFHHEDAGVVCRGLMFTLGGNVHSNNSMVLLDDIGEYVSDDINNALVCVTTLTPCCATVPNRHGEWYYPNGTTVMFRSAGYGFYRNRGDDQTVRLNRASGTSGNSGIYYCEVPDSNNVTQYLYIGLYYENEGNITISDLHYQETSHTLICISSGGPATKITWTKDSTILHVDGVQYEQSQIIRDNVASTYENRLRVIHPSSNASGLYSCTVSNIVGESRAYIDLQVCKDGETRLAINENSDLTAIELCASNTWHSTFGQLLIHLNVPVPTNMIIEPEITLVKIAWDPPESLNHFTTNYNVVCTALVGQQSHKVSIAVSGDQDRATLSSLLPSTTYECCVLAHITSMDSNGIPFASELCETVSTNTPPSLMVIECPEAQTNSSIVSGLGALVGVLVLVLIVLICVVLVVIVRSSHCNFWFNKKSTSEKPSEERLVDNPIYSTPQRPRATSATSRNVLNPIYCSSGSNILLERDVDKKPTTSNYAEIDISLNLSYGSSSASNAATQYATINDVPVQPQHDGGHRVEN